MDKLFTSPSAQAFWGDIVRHLLTSIATVLVAHGYVTQSGAQMYVEEIVGVALYGMGQAWSSRAVWMHRAKLMVALWMSKGSTEAAVVDHIANGLPIPTITTPPTTAPGVPMILLACVLSLGMVFGSSGCAGNPPPGTYSAQGQRTFNAVQFVTDLQALSQTAMNLNATTGKLHLTDRDTQYVRDFALSAASAAQTYATTGSNYGVITRGFSALTQSLSTDAKQNSTLAKVLAIVAVTVNSLPQ